MRSSLTNILLWAIQIGLGAIIAVLCFHLVKARFLLVQILGWLLAAYFVTRYVHGLYLSVSFVIGGEWLEIVTRLLISFCRPGRLCMQQEAAQRDCKRYPIQKIPLDQIARAHRRTVCAGG